MANLTDHFIIAMPDVKYDIFSNSVIYIVEHDTISGALGVMINKPVGTIKKNVFIDIDITTINPIWDGLPLYLGGPVNSDNGFVLHKRLTKKFNNNLFELSANKEILTTIATNNSADKLFISLGYSSWSPFLLEREILDNSWLVVKANMRDMMEVDPIDRYNVAMNLLGIKNVGYLYNDVIST